MVIGILVGWLLGSVLLTLFKDAVPHVLDFVQNGN